ARLRTSSFIMGFSVSEPLRRGSQPPPRTQGRTEERVDEACAGSRAATALSLQALVPALLARACPLPRPGPRSLNPGHGQPVTVTGHGYRSRSPATAAVTNANLYTPQPAPAHIPNA